MPVITRITEQKRQPNRRNIHLDGAFAFGCHLNVVAKFRLREGLILSEADVRRIEMGEVKQECFDRAIRALGARPHSRAELHRKLMRREYGEAVVNAALDELCRMGYVDDAAYARSRAASAARVRHHGRRRAMIELRRAGVPADAAEQAVNEVYADHDSAAVARALVEKQLPRLIKLAPEVARRRLVGMLQRRGFEYDAIRPLLDEMLGRQADRE